MKPQFTVFFDLETGGIEAARPDIQLAAVAIEIGAWREAGSFERKIRFDVAAADPKALEINHYSAEAWADARTEADVVAAFSDWIKPYRSIEVVAKNGGRFRVARMAGHNASDFDGPRLRRMFQRHAAFFPGALQVRDTMHLAFWHFDQRGTAPDNFRLATLCQYFGIDPRGAHDALTDVRLCARLAERMTFGQGVPR